MTTLVPSKEKIQSPDGFLNRVWEMFFRNPTFDSLEVNGQVTFNSGIKQKTTRVTSTYTILVTDEVIYCDTDGGAFTVTLPAGVDGQHFRVINCGQSGNDLTLESNGSEKIYGSTSDLLIYDLEDFDITYEITEGWR